MDYAADFGKEPHEIFKGGRALWFYRWKARRDAVIEVQKFLEKKAANGK